MVVIALSLPRIVISQVDKISSDHEWDLQLQCPGESQARNTEAKRRVVSHLFKQPPARVIAILATHRYGLVELVEAMVSELPNEKGLTILPSIKEENVSPKTKAAAEKGFLERVGEIVKTVTGIVVGAAKVVGVLLAVRKWWKNRKRRKLTDGTPAFHVPAPGPATRSWRRREVPSNWPGCDRLRTPSEMHPEFMYHQCTP
jgi:hypothetical protein